MSSPARARFRKTVTRAAIFPGSIAGNGRASGYECAWSPTTDSPYSDTIPRHHNGLPSHGHTPANGRVTLATAGLLANGSSLAPGLPSFPVARIGRALAAHSCGGSQGFGTAETGLPCSLKGPKREPPLKKG